MKNKIKPQKKDLKETELSDLFDKDFKIMVIKMVTDVRRRMDEQGENFNKKIEYIIK